MGLLKNKSYRLRVCNNEVSGSHAQQPQNRFFFKLTQNRFLAFFSEFSKSSICSGCYITC